MENRGLTESGRFPGFLGFRGSGRFLGFPGGVPVPARSGPGAGSWPDPEIGGFRGPDLAVFGVQIWPFSGSGIRGKSTHSATMVSVVSSSWDPDFGGFLPDLAKSGVPARKNPGPRDPEIWQISGSRDPGSGAQIWPISGSGPDSGISGSGADFRDFARFRDFGYPGT